MKETWSAFWDGFAEGLCLMLGPLGKYLRPHLTFRNLRHLVAFGLAAYLGYHLTWNAWACNGEVTCDFAGQWLMGRMFVTGQAKSLYIVGPEKLQFLEGYV